MKSLMQLYKRGIGPSSSHTMGPVKAVERFLLAHGDAQRYKVILYGSLALTGKGHGTDRAVLNAFGDKNASVEFDEKTVCEHPNTMDIIAYDNENERVRMRVFSVGGGAIEVDGESVSYPEAYPLNSFEEIKEYCKKRNLRLWQYAIECEGKEILDYAKEMWSVMKKCSHEGLESEGILPGGLGVVRRAKQLWQDPYMRESAQSKEDRKVAAFAFAVGEQNASGGEIVTAPTCGACGVLPAVFYYHQRKHNFSDETIAKGLLTAGIIGNLVKTNASISGAECGCQAEIGTACAMAAAGLAELLKMSVEEIEYSAEISLEHHLGLTCDPICGLVQIPCIERNAVAAMRAINAVSLASFLTETRKITLDEVIHTMYETGKDLSVNYRETARGGLAKLKKE